MGYNARNDEIHESLERIRRGNPRDDCREDAERGMHVGADDIKDPN
jgi:hypothetical protein